MDYFDYNDMSGLDVDQCMTFEQFRATGRDVDDVGVAVRDDDLIGANGRVYCDGTIWTIPCVTRGVGWMTIIGNCEYQSPTLEGIERELYYFSKVR